jgi:hypothetical protein
MAVSYQSHPEIFHQALDKVPKEEGKAVFIALIIMERAFVC